jgi:DNA-binding response OmpR family regulator
MKSNILWIEGRQAEGLSFITSLRKKGYSVEVVATGAEAIAKLPELNPNLVVLNAASFRSSGVRICGSLRKQSTYLPIVVIAEAGQALPKGDCANAILVLPFTTRKLINWIVPYMPWDDPNVLITGPIILDTDRRRVQCNGRTRRLTPSLTTLLRTFMQHSGEVLERKALFQRVWSTNYTGDTRTLDVHISWLREAIEDDPRNPVYLKTIRGVGYRLDV